MKYLLLFSVLVLFAGCKFTTPLTPEPTRKIDKALLGFWFSLDDGSTLDIYRLSNYEFLVIDGGKPYVCTHSDLSGVQFVSCKQIENDKKYYGKYAYRAYKLERGVLTIFSLNESLKWKNQSEAIEVITQAAQKGNALDPDPTKSRRYKKKS